MRFSVAVFLWSLSLSLAPGETNPVVHMLVPGFTVQELPVKLSNINNLRFAPDGRLTALGYDGRVHLLRDTDGDGLEDEAKLFWDKPTFHVPVGMAWSSAGLYVSSHGKISLLRDTDGDSTADVEDIVATNWPPTDVPTGGTDAMGVTLDREGNIYFGLLTADYSNPFRIKDGVSHYDINSVRGTIQKLSRDGKKMKTIATGIRVPYTLAFNRHGDLFMTDQEGATWCPGGNALDELNHIIPGRNYGFPPRHEQWLPDLVSEEPVVAFGPQHQSTCGFVFNEPQARGGINPGRKLFGPKSWKDDAFVAGEGRGKIWRVRLVKTRKGYTGEKFLIARLAMLTMDVAISPRGDLYVCCHSGQPDWGTGPRGEGKIFKISHTDAKAPQPVKAWAEWKDRTPDDASPAEVRVAFDRAIDASITARTAEMRLEFGEFVDAADRFEVLKPPYEAVKRQEVAPRGFLRVRASKLEDQGRVLLLNTDPISRALPHALTLPGIKRAGQPGTGDTVDLNLELRGVKIVSPTTPTSHEAPIPPAPAQAEILAGGDFERGRNLFSSERLQCARCHQIRGEGGKIGPGLDILMARDAASVLRDIKEPNASINPDFVAYNVSWRDAELTGFIRAQDETGLRIVGADGKERAVPRAEIRELRASAVSLMPTGLMEGLNEGDLRDLLTFLLHAPPVRTSATLPLNRPTPSPSEEGSRAADTRLPLPYSEGLGVGSAEQIAAVRALRILSPSDGESAEVRGKPTINDQPLSILLVASKQDHGPGQHDYPAWQTNWHSLLKRAPRTQVADAWEWPGAEQFQTANVIVFYFWNHDWNAERLRQLDEYFARGGGVVLLHAATIADKDPEQLAARFGLAAQPGPTKYLHAPFDLKIVAPTNHVITRNLPTQIRFLDEPYWPMIGDTNKIEVLATTELDGNEWPMVWTFQNGKGRVFASIPGHYTWTLDDPLFRQLVLRGTAWAAGSEASRFDHLIGR